MTETNQLQDAFKRTNYQVAGHGQRIIQVLKSALEYINAETPSDFYGSGEIIEKFQTKMANLLGKESAVFFPSGTMAQQIALRIWCDKAGTKKVAYHPLCHLEIHEEDGLKTLHLIEPILLGNKDRLITLEDVISIQEPVSCLLLELPQREIGGQLPEFAAVEAISKYCRGKGIKLHLDGARMFEILPYYNKTAAEVCSLFDSVYISFYKGLGGIAGAILAGPEAFTKEAKVWKRRQGGDLISLYPYILSSDYYFEQRIKLMANYYKSAKELAAFFNQCQGIKTIPEKPVSNMFHVYFEAPEGKVESILAQVYEETGVGLTGYLRPAEPGCYCEISIGDAYEHIPKEKLVSVFKRLDERLRKLS